MKIGYIGLGNLGKTIAKRLIHSGYSLSVWNRTISKADDLEVEIAASPAELVASVDVIFLCLFDSKAVREVLEGKNGLLSVPLHGKIVVDLTTNHFDEVVGFHQSCMDKGGQYLESPVLGSVVPASQGKLTVLVSGRKEAYEKVENILKCIGQHLFYLADPGLACKMKVINNLTLGSFMAALAEATALGEKVGLDKACVLDILDAGGGKSMMLSAKRNKLLNEDFSSHFSCGLIYKDLDCLQDLAYQLKVPLFSGSMAKELYAQTFVRGFDQEDLSAIYKLYKK